MAEKYTKEKKYYLIDTSVDWADEMDVHAFTILEKDEYKKLLKFVKAQDNDWHLGIYLGTNEDTSLDKDEVLDMLKDAERITGEQADFLMEKVGQCEHNIFEDIIESEEESEGEE